MRILMLSQFYPPVAGGQERHVQALAAALAGRGHTVDIVTIATPATCSANVEEQADGVTRPAVRVHRVATTAQRLRRLHSDPERPHSPPVPDPGMVGAITAMLAAGDYDVVHAHDWTVQSALGPARRARIPIVVTLHDYGEVCATKRLVYDGTACPGPSVRRCARCTAAHYGASGPAVAAANFVAAAVRRRAVAEFLPVSTAVAEASGLASAGVAFTVVPNFVPDELVSAVPPGAPAADAPILFAGDATRDKGVGVLCDAYRRLVSPPQLVLAGRLVRGDVLELPAGARAFGLIDHEAVMDLMRGARLVAVPSICPDPCPTVVLEAMAAARPIVASATGGIVDLVDDGVTGLLVPPGEPARLAGAIAQLLADEAMAIAFGRAGAERVRRFTASAVVGQVEAAYERALGASGHRSVDTPRWVPGVGWRRLRYAGLPFGDNKGVTGFDSGRRGGRSEPWSPDPR
jgi:glycogen(starch) synthase